MIDFEEIKKYLPKYLSEKSTKSLFEDLKAFPENINKRFYGNALEDEIIIFQGDGLRDLLVIDLPNTRVEPFPAIIISNTCDISPENERKVEPKILYCPILRISKYEIQLRNNKVDENIISQHIKEIREQRISSIFYLPKGGELPEDCIALLDSINNCKTTFVNSEEVPGKRLFSLSNYGFYVLLFKLSIHFTRIREAVERG
jgi:hypothetical protein